MLCLFSSKGEQIVYKRHGMSDESEILTFLALNSRTLSSTLAPELQGTSLELVPCRLRPLKTLHLLDYTLLSTEERLRTHGM